MSGLLHQGLLHRPVSSTNSDVHLAGTTLSDKTGERRTKVCSDCGTTENIVASGYCTACVKVRNDWTNAIESLGDRVAGSRRAYRALSIAERALVRATAIQLYDLGVDVGTADRAEATEKRGFVYVITNPAWPDSVKVGRAFDPEARLRGYQTSCPDRDYELYAAVYFEDCHWAEKEMHARLLPCGHGGEWFNISPFLARHEINKLRSLL